MTAQNPRMVSVVVSAERWGDPCATLVRRIIAAASGSAWDLELLLAADDGEDAAGKLAGELTTGQFRVRLVAREGEARAGLAALQALRQARGPSVVFVQAESGAPVEEIPRLLELLRDGDTEFVVARRKHPRRLASLMARPLTKARDPLSGFFATRRAVLDRFEGLDPVGPRMGIEILLKCRCARVREVELAFEPARPAPWAWRDWVAHVKHLKRLADFKYKGFSQFAQFCIVGTTGMVVDLFCYHMLLKWLVLGAARALAIWAALTWNFLINRRLTFSYSRKGSILGQYPRYAASCAAGAVVSWGVAVALGLWVDFFARHLLTAAVAGIAAGTLCNFTLSRHWVFRKSVSLGEES